MSENVVVVSRPASVNEIELPTADEGTDYLCSVVFGIPLEAPGDAVLLDVIYTQEPMEYTEPMVADQLAADYGLPVSLAHIESNNGGRGFARAVAALLKQRGAPTVVGWFTQTKNKRARILTAAPWLMHHLLVPEHWAERWPDWWRHIVTFTSDGKAEHDDAEVNSHAEETDSADEGAEDADTEAVETTETPAEE